MRLLLLAVVMAQALDLATWMAMPALNEANPIARGMNTEAAWLAKALLVVLVVAIQPALDPAASRPWRVPLLRRLPRIPATRFRAVGELVALVAICVGCIGAGSNIAVLTSLEAPRPATQPAPVSIGTTGNEQGTQAPAAEPRTPAPSDVPRGTTP